VTYRTRTEVSLLQRNGCFVNLEGKKYHYFDDANTIGSKFLFFDFYGELAEKDISTKRYIASLLFYFDMDNLILTIRGFPDLVKINSKPRLQALCLVEDSEIPQGLENVSLQSLFLIDNLNVSRYPKISSEKILWLKMSECQYGSIDFISSMKSLQVLEISDVYLDRSSRIPNLLNLENLFELRISYVEEVLQDFLSQIGILISSFSLRKVFLSSRFDSQ
jgi:hypothetical protein